MFPFCAQKNLPLLLLIPGTLRHPIPIITIILDDDGGEYFQGYTQKKRLDEFLVTENNNCVHFMYSSSASQPQLQVARSQQWVS